MAFASVADVRRIMGIPSSDTDEERDARLRANLEAVESTVERKLTHISKEGAWVEVYFDVNEDATLHLPADDVVVTMVKAFEYPSSAGVPLSPVELGLGHGYDVTDDGRLFLRPMLLISPFEGATAQRRVRQYHRIEVFYIGTGVIPRAVTEGVAYLAAAYTVDGPRALQNLLSERIGDYSYTTKDSKPEDADYKGWANFFLLPYMRKARVSVI